MFSFASLFSLSSLGLTGTNLSLLYISIILGVIAIVLFYFYFRVIPAKEYLHEQAEAAGYDRPNEYVREKLADTFTCEFNSTVVVEKNANLRMTSL